MTDKAYLTDKEMKGPHYVCVILQKKHCIISP